jgi:uncharacterized protein (TIGR03435 family)
MKRVLRWILVLVMACGTVAHAQSVGGTWQGTLRAGRDLRIVFVISNGEGGELRAVMYSIDQQAPPLTAVVLHKGSALRLTIALLGASYEGTVSADGASIAGTFTQGGKALPLSLVRATADSAWPLPVPPKPMAADAPMAFEVASIKPSNPDRPGKLFTVKGRQVITINTTANDLITFAYELHARQLVGGPPWMNSDAYDVTGQPEGQGLPDMKQLRALMRQLLTDRFKLAFHREQRELPVYAITVANGGPKLTRNDTNPNGLPGLLFKGLGVLPAVNASMTDLAGVMQTAVLDRPVVDRTGLQGRFDFTLTWTPDESQFTSMGVRVPPPSNDPNAPPNLFTAFQEQLGLKLESTRAPAEVLVIERIDKPSDN